MPRKRDADRIAAIGHYENRSLDSIKPYWRNPRRVTDEAVNAVASSIRYYGYQQPIVVDAEGVIIVGHTRYSALRRLGVSEVTVICADKLTPEQVKHYRLVDNRAGEYSFWDHGKMADEIAQLETGVVSLFFPEMDPSAVEEAPDDAAAIAAEWEKVDMTVGFICPSCFHSFDVEVDRASIMAGTIDPRKKEQA